MSEWVQPRCVEAPEGVVTMFCLPHAGSGAAGFFRWRRQVSALNVCPVLLPGRDGRMGEAAIVDAVGLVDALHEALRPYLARPYAIFGHSMGALLGALWAQRIQQEGLPLPRRLVISGRGAPVSAAVFPEVDAMGDEALLLALDARFGGNAAATLLADAEMRAHYLPLLRADLKVVDSAVAGLFMEKLRVPVTVVRGMGDLAVSSEEADRWRGFVEGEFERVEMPGGHFFHFGESEGDLLERLVGLVRK